MYSPPNELIEILLPSDKLSFDLFRKRLNEIDEIVNDCITEKNKVFEILTQEQQENIDELKKLILQKKVQYMKNNTIQYEQQTKIWYTQRTKMLTASSNVLQAISKSPKMVQKLINSKSNDNLSQFKGNVYTAHGNKYEEIVRRVYENRNSTTVLEFGLMCHPKYKFLGASPDGITIDGRLVEIKVPYTRIPTGKPSRQYYIQMQTQMEVFDLDVCDFVECNIREYANEKEYELDVDENNSQLTKNGYEKGLIGRIGYNTADPMNEYKYPPKNYNSLQQKEWLLEQQKILQQTQNKFLTIDYWKITKYVQKEIVRDKIWWNTKVQQKLCNVWKKIEKLRNTK